MKLIDKAALEAKIKKLKGKVNDNSSYCNGWQQALRMLEIELDTLEVKEVDLQKAIDDYIYTHDGRKRLALELDWKCCNLTLKGGDEIIKFAKHFFELGLKAQHDNWKVVDNTNLPQGDRTKIYCVFTKQRYILATVINHPQDGELLQWKCTEFPFHRYDMREGDKYMQIGLSTERRIVYETGRNTKSL